MIKKFYSRKKRKNTEFIKKILKKFNWPLIIILQSFLGYLLVWVFLNDIGRIDVFQQITLNNQAIIFVFFVFSICMSAICYLSFFPSWMFILSSEFFSYVDLAAPFLSKKFLIKQIIKQYCVQLIILMISLFMILIFNINSNCFLLIIIAFYLIYVIWSCHRTFGKINYNIIFFNFISLFSSFMIIFWLFLNILISKFESFDQGCWSYIKLVPIYVALLVVFYVPAIIYYIFDKSYEEILNAIFIIIMSITLILIVFYNGLFHAGFEKFSIIDRNYYNAILNKNDFAKYIFDDQIWDPKDLDDDSNYYLLRGEKLFNLSSYTLFCPLGTYQQLKSSSYQYIKEEKLKIYTAKCVVLNIDKVMFKKLEEVKLKYRVKYQLN